MGNCSRSTSLPTKRVEFFSQPQCPLGSPRSGVGGPPPSAVDDGSAELGTACCRLVRRHQFQMSHVVASVHRTRLTEPMRRPQREHENRDIWEKLQCRVTTVRHETRFESARSALGRGRVPARGGYRFGRAFLELAQRWGDRDATTMRSAMHLGGPRSVEAFPRLGRTDLRAVWALPRPCLGLPRPQSSPSARPSETLALRPAAEPLLILD